MTGFQTVGKIEHRGRTRARLPRVAIIACVLPLALLLVEFLLGMYLNLFVEHPKTAGITAVHQAVGYAIFLANLFALVMFARTRRPGLLALATLGLLATALAIVAGFRFLATGQNGWSYTMAVGFVLVATADVLIPVRALVSPAS
jgi:hypothetical protein